MMLELRSLRCLVTLDRRLNFGRAADDLGISQPALTKTIQAIERQFGTRLFDRDRSGVHATPQGRLIVDRAAVLVAEADELERSFVQIASGKAGKIRFGMAPLPAQTFLAGSLAEQMRSSPDLVCEVVVRTVPALWPLLINDEIEFFVGAEGQISDTPPVRAHLLGYVPFGLIVRANHPLIMGSCPGAKFPILLANRIGSPHELPEYLIDRVSAVHTVEDYGTLTALTLRSDAIWISSTYAVAEEIAAGRLAELPLPPNEQAYQIPIRIYSLERRSESVAAGLLKQSLRRHLKLLAG